jgi:assimilatory nitrate reductase catalytic subunit
MATLPTTVNEIIKEFGPHRSVATRERLDPGAEPDKVVKTHCCFCGQQCGI